MNRASHTTKKGPGRRHVDGTYRNGKQNSAKRRLELPFGFSGAKLARKVILKTLTKRS